MAPGLDRHAQPALGVPPEGQFFLGYPDQGLETLLGTHRASAYTSAYTGVASVPYAQAAFPGHPYTGESLERDFAAVIERVRPTLILAPSLLDAHPDHSARFELGGAVALLADPDRILVFAPTGARIRPSGRPAAAPQPRELERAVG